MQLKKLASVKPADDASATISGVVALHVAPVSGSPSSVGSYRPSSSLTCKPVISNALGLTCLIHAPQDDNKR